MYNVYEVISEPFASKLRLNENCIIVSDVENIIEAWGSEGNSEAKIII